jgi:hypothetical protein
VKQRHVGLSVAIAGLGPFAVAGALALARDEIASSTTALLLVLSVIAVAVLVERPSFTLLGALSAALGFDFFHTRPYGTFTIHDGTDIQAAILLVVTAGLVGELVSWGKRYRQRATELDTDVARLSETVALASEIGPVDELVLVVADKLRDLLQLRDCRFDRLIPSSPAGSIDRHGIVVQGGVSWPVETTGLPGPHVELPVTWLGRPLGRFVLSPSPGVPVPTERIRVALSLADAVAPRLWAEQERTG